MKIFVCVKPVFATDDRIKINQDSDIVSLKGSVVINPFDEYAIEESLRLREMWGDSTVTVVSYGNEDQESVSYSALAMGADNAVFITSKEKTLTIDSFKTATQLFNYMAKENPDCIIMGKEAADTQNAAVGPILASLMEFPIATNVHKCDFFEDFVEIERSVSGSIQQQIQMKFPCVITVTKGINKPRYPSIKNIINAKNKPFLRLEEQEVLYNHENSPVLFSYPPEKSKCCMLKKDEHEIADQILKILKMN